MAEPFPHPDSYVDDDDALYDRMPSREDFPGDEPFAIACRAWNEERDYFEERKTVGAIAIQDNGCGFATLLVISGPLAGTVWWDGRATCDLIVPLSLDHAGGAQPVRFGDWLAHGSWKLLPPGWG
ncbi:hypothetical protein [Actinoplanes flavus]|uniref:Uncharacterized protein n=1 Tax=Actinoplanes flavus TaxID=2820290 RepID=A0ABS3V0Q3_9ACTN|nr:hypothetical protein [Actinoplanes flavus]MBO3744366.1 hypothetical protein [Actinoplanes flavus]